MRSRVCLAVCSGLLALPATLLSAPAGAAGITFSNPVKLLGITGGGGGEPSIATDQKGNVYVTSPQGIPSGLDGHAGVGFWASHDHGASWSNGTYFGSYIGGGDSDVQVAADDGTVGILDLEAVASAVCFSHDKGASFQSASPIPDVTNCATLPTGQAGPSADREWLTVDKGGRAYVSYHEFFSAQPLIFRTDSFGSDGFLAAVCGPVVNDIGIELNVPQDITGGTLMSKPILDKQGNIYILFTTTTQPQNFQALANGSSVSGTFSQIYLAVSKDHCSSFSDYIVYDGSSVGSNSVQFGDIFNDLAIDGAGNLYAIGAGFVGSTPPPSTTADVFLFSSTDGGAHWTGPHKVNSDVGAHMLPAAVGGPQAGQLAIGYFRTTNGKTNPNDSAGAWTYTVSESTNATNAMSASFVSGDVQPGRVFHNGDICNSGILCGTGLPGTGSDRSLVDFTSATIDGDGCPIFVFAGNPDGKSAGTFNYVSKQNTGCFAGGSVAAAPQPTPSPTPTPSPSASATPSPSASPTPSGATQPQSATPVHLPNTSRAAGAAVSWAAAGVFAALAVRRRRRRDG